MGLTLAEDQTDRSPAAMTPDAQRRGSAWPLDFAPREAAANEIAGDEPRREDEGAGVIVWGTVLMLLVLLIAAIVVRWPA